VSRRSHVRVAGLVSHVSHSCACSWSCVSCACSWCVVSHVLYLILILCAVDAICM